MSVTVDIVRQDFAGDASTTLFPTSLLITGTGQLLVYDIDETVSPATSTLLVLGVDYTESLVTPLSLPSLVQVDVSLLYPGGLPVNHILAVVRNAALLQDEDFTDVERFPSTAVELSLDRVVLAAQQAKWLAERSIRAPAGDQDPTSLELPIASQRALTYPFFDAAGNLVVQAGTIDTGLVAVSAYGETLVAAANAGAARTLLAIGVGTLAARPAAGDAGQRYFATDTQQVFYDDGSVWIEFATPPPIKTNHCINPQFAISTQYLTGTTPAAAFGGLADADVIRPFDGWRVYGDGTNINVAQNVAQFAVSLPNDISHAIQVTPVTADTKHGIACMVTHERVRAFLASSKASLRFRLALASGSTSPVRFRAAVIAWSGSIDDMTADHVSAWNAQGSNPSLAASFAYCNTPSTHFTVSSVSPAFDTFEIEDIDVPSNAVNLLIFIWADVGAVGSSTGSWHCTGVQLVASDNLDGAETRVPAQDASLCAQHYYSIGNDVANIDIRWVAGGAETWKWSFPLSRELHKDAVGTPNVRTVGDWVAAGTNLASVTFASNYRTLSIEAVTSGAGASRIRSSDVVDPEHHIWEDGWT